MRAEQPPRELGDSVFTATITAPDQTVETVGEFETVALAWWALYHDRVDAETAPGVVCELCGDESSHGVYGDCDDDTETGRALASMARTAATLPRPGGTFDTVTGETITGPTPADPATVTRYTVRAA